jgi:hypothetical protein
VLDELREQLDAERDELGLLLDAFRPLLARIATGGEPTTIELAALAGFLQSLYNGIECTGKRILKLVDKSLPRGPAWHSELLQALITPNQHRPAVISPAMHSRLKDYCDFRHFYHHGYASRLDWGRMTALVRDGEAALNAFLAEIDSFLQLLAKEHES